MTITEREFTKRQVCFAIVATMISIAILGLISLISWSLPYTPSEIYLGSIEIPSVSYWWSMFLPGISIMGILEIYKRNRQYGESLRCTIGFSVGIAVISLAFGLLMQLKSTPTGGFEAFLFFSAMMNLTYCFVIVTEAHHSASREITASMSTQVIITSGIVGLYYGAHIVIPYAIMTTILMVMMLLSITTFCNFYLRMRTTYRTIANQACTLCDRLPF